MMASGWCDPPYEPQPELLDIPRVIVEKKLVCIDSKMIELTEAESKLIEQIRQLEWGKIEVVIQAGKPTMISVKKDIKLNINLTFKQ